jgi:phosphoacetylglucosamine mutase
MTSLLQELHDRYPKQDKYLTYGTAGFRDRADLPLASVCARMGVMAAKRSHALSSCVGIMITASHNAECDNGIKLVDHDGGMLHQNLEPFAVKLANAVNYDDFVLELKSFEQYIRGVPSTTVFDVEQISLEGQGGVVMVGWDTRPHSPVLVEAVRNGVRACGALVLELGEVTTPQVHYAVQDFNYKKWTDAKDFAASVALQRYYHTLTNGFVELMDSCIEGDSIDEDDIDMWNVVVDTAYGVGCVALQSMQAVLEEQGAAVTLDLRNLARSGPVNDGCGAELVQKGQIPPAGVDESADKGKLLCSFDGDADRVVFHTFGTSRGWALLDGDRIATLIATFLVTELEEAGVSKQFRLGCVQTAYANGASTRYLQSLGVSVAVAKTGVKHLHHAALFYDLGLYFEANGHGTVLFSADFLTFVLSAHLDCPNEPRKAMALRRLHAFTQVINQAVGDSISDMLASLTCMQVLGVDHYGWLDMYTELPSRQLKCPHAKKGKIKCSEDETRAVVPEQLQVRLDQAMAKFESGRCFVRPSGTEDVVRVYAEASTQDGANALADECIKAIHDVLDSL